MTVTWRYRHYRHYAATDQVDKNFNSILRRMESRFIEVGSGGLPGRIWLVSSEGEKFSMINRIVDSYPDKSRIYVDRSVDTSMMWAAWVPVVSIISVIGNGWTEPRLWT